jgi:hypothetical protein
VLRPPSKVACLRVARNSCLRCPGFRGVELLDLRPLALPHADFELDYCARLDRLLSGPPVDGVLVHLRVTVILTARPIRREVIDGRAHYSINPALFRRGHRRPTASPERKTGREASHADGPERPRGADAYGNAKAVRNPAPSGRRIAGFRVRNLNALLGAFLGLDRWAIGQEMLRFDDLVRACKERGIPLFVLGPTPASRSYWNNRVVRKTNAAIRRRLPGRDVPYALIEQLADPAGRPLVVRADGIHLTVDGHRFVADQVYEGGMRDWVARILASRG